MKQVLRSLFLQTLGDAALDRVMASSVARHGDRLVAGSAEADLAAADRILVAAIGKAAVPMCRALMPLLPEDRTSWTVVAPGPPEDLPGSFEVFVGGHPYPNSQSGAAARRVLDQATALGRGDLLLCLLSGGGSAICEAPLDPALSLADLRECFRVLVTCGANIVDMNILRKHMSLIKGGRLAEAASPAAQMTLYVSDVPPDEPSSVASGPTMPDESTCEDAYAIAERLEVVQRLPRRLRKQFEDHALRETPKPGSLTFERSQWVCLLDNADVLERLEDRARDRGWIVERDLSVDDANVETAAEVLLQRLEELARRHPGKTVAVSTGGELSSPVTGNGMGGRNQAFVLWVARKLAERGMRAAVLSAGTDGIDGNSPAAGSVADEKTVPRARALGLDPADFDSRSDSYRFFRGLDDLVVTGPTGNNVRDLRILAAGPS